MPSSSLPAPSLSNTHCPALCELGYQAKVCQFECTGGKWSICSWSKACYSFPLFYPEKRDNLALITLRTTTAVFLPTSNIKPPAPPALPLETVLSITGQDGSSVIFNITVRYGESVLTNSLFYESDRPCPLQPCVPNLKGITGSSQGGSIDRSCAHRSPRNRCHFLLPHPLGPYYHGLSTGNNGLE